MTKDVDWRLLTLVVLWVLGEATGCSLGSLLGTPLRCASDASCPAADVCVQGVCVPPLAEGEGEGSPEEAAA